MSGPRPLRDNVWLLFPPDARETGGILVRQDRPDKWMDATVVAAGPDVPAELGVGDKVIANLFDGMPVEHEGEIYRCVPSSKVLAVLEP